jgi:hypothetical protein
MGKAKAESDGYRTKEAKPENGNALTSLQLQFVRIAPFRGDFTTDGTDGTDGTCGPNQLPIREIRQIRGSIPLVAAGRVAFLGGNFFSSLRKDRCWRGLRPPLIRVILSYFELF